MTNVGGGVGIQADEIDGGVDDFHVGAREVGGVWAEVFEIGGVVLAFHDGGEEHAGGFAEGDFGGVDVFGGFDDGDEVGDIFCEADLGAGVGAKGLDGEAVGEDGVVAGLGEDFAGDVFAGGEGFIGGGVGLIDEAPELVDGEEAFDAVAEAAGDEGGVVGEIVGAVAGFPAAVFVFGPLGEIPVEKGEPGFDVGGEEFVGEAAVEVEAFFVDASAAVGDAAGPGGREAVGFEAELFHEGDVLFVAVVMIAGDVAGVIHGDSAGAAAEGVPDAGGAAVFGCGAFDLIGGGGGTPEEIGGEGGEGGGHGGSFV